jgi:hypothetical protein
MHALDRVKEEGDSTPNTSPTPLRIPPPHLRIPRNFDDLPLAPGLSTPIITAFACRSPSPPPINRDQFTAIYHDIPANEELILALEDRPGTQEQVNNLFDLLAVNEWTTKYHAQAEERQATSHQLMTELWATQRRFEREWDRLTTQLQGQWEHQD